MKRLLQFAAVFVLLASITLSWDSNQGGLRFNAVYAQATGTLSISWTPPTMYTDGTALLEQDLDYYTFYCDGAAVQQVDSIIGTWTRDVSTVGMTEGNHVCHLTTTTLTGSESGPSNTINFTIGPRVPMAPAGLTSL